MNILHVRSVPENLYQKLQQLADAHKRSLSAQVITMLTAAVEEEERRAMQAKTLASIHDRRFHRPKDAPSTLDLLHEDRSR